MAKHSRARLAVDIGGTFTDVALEKNDGAIITSKALTTRDAPERGVIAAIEEALAQAALSFRDIDVVIHGTTLATNALIEKRGAKTALLVTEGHRDTLEMAYENRFEQYDVMIDRPPPLVPRWLRLPVRERLSMGGKTLVALDEKSVRNLIPVIEMENVESVAIGFLHSYVNPAHERRVAAILTEANPALKISLSSDVAPEIREYERQTTTVANAYVRPLMEKYLRSLEQALIARGFSGPFLLVTSGGGLCTVETATKYPIRLVESGPAGGAVLAATLARRLDIPELLAFDMGGTTAKLCMIDEFEPTSARVFEVDRSYRFKKGSGMPVRIPVIELVEIGAGGGSVAQVDAMKRINVGPESAGADPGPACYGRGGVKPTVTDADFISGRIIPEKFAGGAIALDMDAATSAMIREIGAPLGLEVDTAAFGVGEIVDESMASAGRAHAVEQGRDIARRTMIAFGGAAPLHAARLAEKLGLERLIIPAGAGVGSALGFLLAPASYEITRSLPTRLQRMDPAQIAALFNELSEEAQAVVDAAAPDEPCTQTRTAFMRYVGQGHEIPVAVEHIDAGSLAESFFAAYQTLYGRTIPGMEVEILSWSIRVSAPAPAIEKIARIATTRKIPARETRKVFDAALAKAVEYGVFERGDLRPGDCLAGPALIVEPQTTTVVTSTFDAQIDAAGNIDLKRKTLK